MHTQRVSSVVLALAAVSLAGAWLPAVRAQEGEGQEAENETPPARFSVDRAWAQPGATLDVAFGIAATDAVSMASWSFEYDPAVFEFLEPVLPAELRQLLERAFDSEVLFIWHGDPEAGWAQVELVVDSQGRPDRSLPPGLAQHVADLRFRVLPSAAPGAHALRFSRRGEAPYAGDFADENGPVYNAIRFAGAPFDLAERFRGASEPALEDGTISVAPIIGDVGIFVRGDANLDFTIDITDPVMILDGIFLNGGAFPCAASADANSDAEIDIGDPITILNHLFLGTADWIPTSERVGETDNGLPCDELYESSDEDRSP